METFTAFATDHRPGAFGDDHSATFAYENTAHEWAQGLNCGLYSINNRLFEWDGINAPVEISPAMGN